MQFDPGSKGLVINKSTTSKQIITCQYATTTSRNIIKGGNIYKFAKFDVRPIPGRSRRL